MSSGISVYNILIWMCILGTLSRVLGGHSYEYNGIRKRFMESNADECYKYTCVTDYTNDTACLDVKDLNIKLAPEACVSNHLLPSIYSL